MIFNIYRLSVITIALFFFPFTNGKCQLTSNQNIFSPLRRLQFGNYLYHENDFLRASNEFKEYLKFNNNDTVQFKYADCFYKIGRFSEAADNFKVLMFGSSLSEEAKLLFYQSNFFLNDFKSFRELTLNQNYISVKYRNEVERLKYSTYFFDNSFLPDENLILNPFPDSVQSQLSNFYNQKKFPKYKRITTAALLSALVPGAGKIYTGNIGDGITAFVATALSAYLAYDNFKSDHQFRGWLFTGLAAFFYGGNIYGSAASAQIYNASIKLKLNGEIKFFFEQNNYFLPKIDFQ